MTHNAQEDEKPPFDPYPTAPYVLWAANRNKHAILRVFQDIFPRSGNALELASGAGVQINHFAPHFPNVQFQPSDYDLKVFDVIKQRREEAGNKNVRDPIKVDLNDQTTWPDPKERLYDAIFVINHFQVAPLSNIDGITAIGERLLTPSGFIAIYGPFKLYGKYTTPSNEAYDKEIEAIGNPEWGVKDVRDLERSANNRGLILKNLFDAPTNNFIVQFARA